MTTSRFKFVLPQEIPSLNEYLGWHWIERSRIRKVYESEILVQKANKFKYPKEFPLKKCTIKVISYRHSLITDYDNRILKGLLDALVNQGIIEDDNEKVIGVPEYEQFVDSKNRRTEIYIEGR